MLNSCVDLFALDELVCFLRDSFLVLHITVVCNAAEVGFKIGQKTLPDFIRPRPEPDLNPITDQRVAHNTASNKHKIFVRVTFRVCHDTFVGSFVHYISLNDNFAPLPRLTVPKALFDCAPDAICDTHIASQSICV